MQDELRDFVIRWNNQYPFDYEYRLKYNIPFGSSEHRASNFLLMATDLAETKLINEYFQQLQDKENEVGEYKSSKMKQSEIDEDFENLDLTQFND